MSLDQALEALIGSEPFERLLLERARPIVARAAAGEDLVAAAVATALESPVMAVAAGPREAEALAAEAASYLGDDRVAFLPAWEALPYEGIGPTPEIAARRADAVHRLRAASGAFVVVAPALAAMQGLIPTLGAIPPLELVAGLDLAPDSLADRLVDPEQARFIAEPDVVVTVEQDGRRHTVGHTFHEEGVSRRYAELGRIGQFAAR